MFYFIELFTSCALFLRQSGLNEQYFALIKLALELNIPNGEKFSKIQPLESDQKLLIEYEEIILKSGLPMNEIWLRIEKLRENFNFLPLPSNTLNPIDPQRIVFNEDICYFIYPLAQQENRFTLIIIILKLLKIPILLPSSLRKQFLFNLENLNEFDALEEILPVFLYQTITRFSNNSLNFDSILYDIVKDTLSGPSFIITNIGYEIYLNTISEILLICSECYHEDERRRMIFLIIWLQFYRIQVIIEKFSNKLTTEKMKIMKSKIKAILKRNENRNTLNFYIEYALIEYEFNNNLSIVENIFITSITNSKSLASSTSCSSSSSSTINQYNLQNSDLCYAFVTYVEILLKSDNYTKALKILIFYALDISLENLNNNDDSLLTETRKLMTLKRLTERLSDLLAIEKNVYIMELEQYFLPDYFINLLKAKIYCQILLNGKLEAIASIEKILRHFTNDDTNLRHQYLKEMIYEFYIKILQITDKKCFTSNLLIYEILKKALNEYPDNLFILRIGATLDGQPWYKIRKLLMMKNHQSHQHQQQYSPISIVFLIASARYRCNQFLDYEMSETYSRRVYNILKECVDKNSPLRKNSIIWRLFLRSLCDIKTTFDKCKNHLYSALDECPWNKVSVVKKDLMNLFLRN